MFLRINNKKKKRKPIAETIFLMLLYTLDTSCKLVLSITDRNVVYGFSCRQKTRFQKGIGWCVHMNLLFTTIWLEFVV